MNTRFLATIMCAPIAILSSTIAHAEDLKGLRVELHGGYDAVSSEYTVDGATVGVGIGYDIPLGQSLLFGVEANLDYSSVKDEGVYFGASYSQAARRDIEISARLGTKVGQSTLVYIKAGYSNAGYEGAAAGYGIWAYEKGTSDGLRIGGGVEQKIATNWYVKSEYRFTRYGAEDVNRNQVIFGIGHRF